MSEFDPFVNIFQNVDEPFTLASGKESHFKIECDALSDGDIDFFGNLIWKFSHYQPFGLAIGVPTGGMRLANFMQKNFATKLSNDVLLVDDVYTTGGSIRKLYEKFDHKKSNIYGWVIFARGRIVDKWCNAIFQSHSEF
jgi:hypothetical protein